MRYILAFVLLFSPFAVAQDGQSDDGIMWAKMNYPSKIFACRFAE
jgi:hypothetical protein